MTYMVFIIDHIHHLMNESKMHNFTYNNDQRMYNTSHTYIFTFFFKPFYATHFHNIDISMVPHGP